MNAKQITLYVALPLVVIVGATAYHRSNRNAELSRQAAVKAAGEVTVSLATVEQRPFRLSLPFTGSLLAVNRAELKAEVQGRVTRVAVSEGDRVGRGTLLSTQDEEDLQLAVQAAEAQLAQAKAQADQARRDHERMQMLLEKRSVTRQAAQQAETYFNASVASQRAAESNLGLAKSRMHKAQIKAPFEGQVAKRAIQPGEMLNPGQPAFEVVDNRRLEILADLPAEAAAQVKVGMKAAFKLSGTTQTYEGRVAQVAPSLQADGRTLRIRIEVPNPDNSLKSGFFAEGEILSETKQDRPALPANVLTLQGKEAEVFIAENGTARRRKVVVGAEQGGWRPVEGLALGVQAVALGRDQVTDGTRLKVSETGKGK